MATGEPITWTTSKNIEISETLPDSVISCLQNAKYLHLGTCVDNKPHVSLMNYTYIPSPSYQPSDADALGGSDRSSYTLPPGPIIVMTTNPSSRKTLNLIHNPNVSLLVHDWVSSRPPPNRGMSPPSKAHDGRPAAERGRQGGGGSEGRSSLASLLMGMNSSEMGSISVTLYGRAHILARGSEAEKWCREQHLRFNGFDDGPAPSADTGRESAAESISRLSGSPNATFHPPASKGEEADGSTGREGDDDVRIVVVSIQDGRIADHKGGVRDFKVTAGESV